MHTQICARIYLHVVTYIHTYTVYIYILRLPMTYLCISLQIIRVWGSCVQTGLLPFFFLHRVTALYEDNLDKCLFMEFTYPSSKHDRQRAIKDEWHCILIKHMFCQWRRLQGGHLLFFLFFLIPTWFDRHSQQLKMCTKYTFVETHLCRGNSWELKVKTWHKCISTQKLAAVKCANLTMFIWLDQN